MASVASIRPGRDVAGKYRLKSLIAGGGMGSVWLAEHLALEMPVAVKFMHQSFADHPGARSRFEREAKAAAMIRSPHVVHVYDHGIDQDNPYIVMEYLQGEDLAERLRRCCKLRPDEAVPICTQMCMGLYRAHKLGIVHRDLKPANTFLCAPDDEIAEVVKILDFGIAKETGARHVVTGERTSNNTILGSPQYLSPEQCRGLAVDARSDLWSLGVIMFRVLTGTRPFNSDDVRDLLVRICTDPIPKPSALNDALGAAVDAFFVRALERDPERRFQDAREFAIAFAGAMPVSVGELAADAWDATIRARSGSWDTAAKLAVRPRAPSPEKAPAIPQSGAAASAPTQLITTSAVRVEPPSTRRWAPVALVATGLVAAVSWFALREPPSAESRPASVPAETVEPASRTVAPPAGTPSTAPSAAPIPSASASSVKQQRTPSSAPRPPPPKPSTSKYQDVAL